MASATRPGQAALDIRLFVCPSVCVFAGALSRAGTRGANSRHRMEPCRALNASISGIAGIGHILTGVSLVLLLLQNRKRAS